MIIAVDNAAPLLAAFRLVDLLPAAGIALIMTSLLMAYRKRRARVMGPRRTPHEELEHARQMRGVRGDLDQVMVEIDEMAKRVASQLDAKVTELDMVIEEADKRIAELGALLDRAERKDVVESPRDEAAERPPDLKVAGSEHADAAPSSSDPDDPLARSVYRLADQGLGPDQIASKLNEHIGKIELILALRSAG